MIETGPATDLDEVTAGPVPSARTAPPPDLGSFATPPAKEGEPFLANPLKLAPTGSGAGHVSRADFARSGVILASVYGLLQMAQPTIVRFLTALGPDGHPFVTHGDLFADAFSACVAAAVAIAHVVTAYAADNRPRTDGPGPPAPAPPPARVP